MKGCEPLTNQELVNVAAYMQGRNRHRNRALWWLGCQTGLRISELLSLDIEDVQSPSGDIKASILVQRCNTKGRVDGKLCDLSREAAKTVAAWLTEARARNGAERSWPLFHSSTGRRISRFMAARIIRRAMLAAGIRHAVLGCHTMRKSAIRIVWKRLEARKLAGEQINVIAELQRFTGHRTVDSLLKYMQTIEGLVREVVLETWAEIGRLSPTLEPPKPLRKPATAQNVHKIG